MDPDAISRAVLGQLAVLFVSSVATPPSGTQFLITIAVPKRDFGESFHAIWVRPAPGKQPPRLEGQVLRLKDGPAVECAARHILETWIRRAPTWQSEAERLKIRELFVVVTVANAGDTPPSVVEVNPVHHLPRYSGVTRGCSNCGKVDALCTCDMGGYAHRDGRHRYSARLLCRRCGERWHADIVLPRHIATPPMHFLVEPERQVAESRKE